MLKKINFFQKITRKILINLLLEMKVGHLSLEEKKDKISIGNKNDIDTFSSDIQVLDPKKLKNKLNKQVERLQYSD